MSAFKAYSCFFRLQWGLFDRNFGRLDTQEPDPEGRVPQWEKASVKEMKDKFSAIGFTPRQVRPLPEKIRTLTRFFFHCSIPLLPQVL